MVGHSLRFEPDYEIFPWGSIISFASDSDAGVFSSSGSMVGGSSLQQSMLMKLKITSK